MEFQRHISSCLPPLFRPPNPAPDLQRLVSDALEAIHAQDAPSTLLDIHLARGDVQDQRPLSPTDAKTGKGKGPSTRQWMRMTRVRAAAERDEGWDAEVSERVRALTEASPTKRPKLERGPKGVSASPSSSPPPSSYPLTQPLGESSLAAQYLRRPSTPPAPPVQPAPPTLSQLYRTAPVPPESTAQPNSSPPHSRVRPASPRPQFQIRFTSPTLPADHLSPASASPASRSNSAAKSPTPPPLPLESSRSDSPEEASFPLPPPSQKRTGRFCLEALSPSSQRALGLAEPFRGRGSPHVDGGFSGKRGSAGLGDGGVGGSLWGSKRSRVEGIAR